MKRQRIERYTLDPEDLGAVVKAGLRALHPELPVPDDALIEFYLEGGDGTLTSATCAEITVTVDDMRLPPLALAKAA